MRREYSDQITGDTAFFKTIPSLALHLVFYCCHLIPRECPNGNVAGLENIHISCFKGQ